MTAAGLARRLLVLPASALFGLVWMLTTAERCYDPRSVARTGAVPAKRSPK